MIEQIIIRKQTPTEGKYLYRLDEDSNTYTISTQVFLGKNDTEWDECTEEQKIAFEAHNAKVQEEMDAKMNEQ